MTNDNNALDAMVDDLTDPKYGYVKPEKLEQIRQQRLVRATAEETFQTNVFQLPPSRIYPYYIEGIMVAWQGSADAGSRLFLVSADGATYYGYVTERSNREGFYAMLADGRLYSAPNSAVAICILIGVSAITDTDK